MYPSMTILTTKPKLEARCLRLCPINLNCAAIDDVDTQKRCFFRCRQICQLNPLNVPQKPTDYQDDSYMRAFNFTN